MKPYYFTHGQGSAFGGGWSIVIAENLEQAIKKYNEVHPPVNNHADCAMVYTDKSFRKTSMFLSGNFGMRRKETIK